MLTMKHTIYSQSKIFQMKFSEFHQNLNRSFFFHVIKKLTMKRLIDQQADRDTKIFYNHYGWNTEIRILELWEIIYLELIVVHVFKNSSLRCTYLLSSDKILDREISKYSDSLKKIKSSGYRVRENINTKSFYCS